MQAVDAIALLKHIPLHKFLHPLPSLFQCVPLWKSFKGSHLAKSFTKDCSSRTHFTTPSNPQLFFFHWTVSILPSCLPSHWLSKIHCFSICILHPWLAVLRIDLQSFWIQYVPHFAFIQHLEPSYQAVPFKMLLTLQI